MASMNLEDIVDMDWLNSNTTGDPMFMQSPCLTTVKDESVDTCSSGYLADACLSNQSLLLEQNMVYPAMNLNPDISPLSSGLFSLAENYSVTASEAQDATMSPPSSPMAGEMQNIKSELIMPTTEQIQQLIEIAKRHLALRENQQSHSVDLASLEQQSFDSRTLIGVPSTSPPPRTIDPENLVKKEQEDSEIKSGRRDSLYEDVLSLEAFAESDGIDIKKLTPKERRQLRNKISARNFRVRRKEYITALEAKVDKHRRNAEELQAKLLSSEEENKQLRQQVDSLRQQNQALLQQQNKISVNPAAASSVESVRCPSSPLASSPLPKPNLNKDISMLGTKASDTYRNDNRILVSNAVIPAWNFDRIIRSPKASPPHVLLDKSVTQIIGCALAFLARVYIPLQVHDGDLDADEESCANKSWTPPLLPDERDFTVHQDVDKAASQSHAGGSFIPDLEYLYDTLIMSALMVNVQTGTNVTDKSFWWWDTPYSR